MTRIKVSGVVQASDAALAGTLGADIVACVFYARSPRYVTILQAWSIRRAMPASVRLCGVFVDTPTPVVRLVAESCHLDYVQLFGSETRGDTDALGTAAFKAITVTATDQVDAATRAFLPRRMRRADEPGLLLHLSGPVGAAWDVAASVANRVPLILAATELDPHSVQAAIRTARPWAVDVWDAVESEPGRLDPARLADFIQATREAEASLGLDDTKEARP